MKNDIKKTVENAVQLIRHATLQNSASSAFKCAFAIFDDLLGSVTSYDESYLVSASFKVLTPEDFKTDYIVLRCISFNQFCYNVAENIYDAIFEGLQKQCERRCDFDDLNAWYDFTESIDYKQFAVLLRNYLFKQNAVSFVMKDNEELVAIETEYNLTDLKEYAESYASLYVKQRVTTLDD